MAADAHADWAPYAGHDELAEHGLGCWHAPRRSWHEEFLRHLTIGGRLLQRLRKVSGIGEDILCVVAH